MRVPVSLLIHPTPFALLTPWKALPRSIVEFSTLHVQRRHRGSNASLGQAFSTSTGSLKPGDTTRLKTTNTTAGKITRSRQKIRTLDPSKLTPDDYIDISHKSSPTLSAILRSSNSPPASPRSNPQIIWVPCASSSFPAGTHGFLYYHVGPYSSPIAGELRIRVTSSRDPASFATGSDLLDERSMLWRYPLYKMVCRPDWSEFVALLLQDGLVSQRTLDLVTAAVAPLRRASANTQPPGAASSDERHPSVSPSNPVLSAFGQEFPFRYTLGINFCGVFAGPDTIFTHRVRHITTFWALREGKRFQYFPFAGSAVCCFERSMLPEHAGKRVVVIRVKRFIDTDPIRPVPPPRGANGRAHLVEQLRPREGELLKVAIHDRVQPWAADVDKVWKESGAHGGTTPWKVLRVLFENEELYGSPHTS
ncbi:hypothetical protein GSI_07956 [Ganoderma sinense ZZ0214-1]|uniref:Uncharacterized protein n=1 Tax=Ganoderma sinense ZZ0214-1 TaxID=1077348 RepID=A0A2G8S8H8_9APHY|nr:hypothetical protein GSI_07956 [Ganoderma sinense ZZ0214-1]